MDMNNLIALYQQRLNLQGATFLRIEHEDATVAIVYKVTQFTGAPLILKICTRVNDYVREVYFLKYFAGNLPVPRIIDVVQPEPGVHGAILMECLQGTLLTAEDCTDALVYEIGSLLARIHSNRAAGYGDLTQPHDLSTSQATHFTMKFQEGLDECTDHLPQLLIEQCRTYFDANLQLLISADGPCITHRDFRAGNVMVCDGKVQGIIDWSASRAGFAQEDFVFLEHSGWPMDADTKKAFLDGYASIRAVPDYTTMMPLLRLSRAIAVIGFTVKRGTWQSNDRRIYHYNRESLETFFNKF